MRHAVLALVLACGGCSSCREDEPAPVAPPPALDAAAPISSSRSPSDASATTDIGDAAQPSPDAPWELVGKRKSSDRPLWIAEVGTRVIVGDRSPLAWADGAGPLVAAPRIETDYVAGVAGAHPSAVFVASEKRMHQLVGDGWRDLGPLPPRMRTIVTWGGRAVVVSSFIEMNSMPALSPDERPATTLHPFVAEGEHPPVLDLEPGFGTFAASGTRDGHLWLLGFRAGRTGMWLAHVVQGKKAGYQLYPGSEKCDDAGFGIYVYRSRVVATSGERAFLFVVNDAAECMGPMGAYLYERSEKGFAGIPLPKKEIESLGTEILGSAMDGTLYIQLPPPESTLYRRDVSGKMTKATVPKSCVATRIVVRDDGDTWMTARCDTHDGIYRRGRSQATLAL